MTNQAKVILSGEDKLSALFAAVGRNADKLGFNLDGLKGGAVAALGALAVPVSAGAIVALGNEARKAIDEFNDLKDVTGSTVESISALDGLARETGASFETVSSSLVKFNGVLKDADPDKGAGAVLKALNLDIAELKRLDPAEALRRTAVALQGYADDGDKARAVQELFGKSVKEVGPFLKDLAEAGTLNARVTTQQAEEVERFNKELFKLQAAAEDAGRSITVGIIAALNEAIDKFREGRLEGKSTFELWSKYLPLLNGPAGAASFIISSALGDSGKPAASTAVGSAGDQSVAELARLSRQAARPSLSIPADPSAKSKRTGSSTPKDPYAEANRYLETLRKQLQTTEGLTVYEKLLADIRAGSLGKLTPQLQAQLELTAKQIDAEKELNAITKEFDDLKAKSNADKAALVQEGRGIWEETRTPLEQLNIEQAKLQRLLDANVISFDTFARKSLDLEESLRGGPTDALKELSKGASLAQEFGATFTSAFEDAVVGGEGLREVIKGLEQDILRMVTRKLFTDPLGNAISGALSGSDIFSSIFGGFRAAGGPVQSGKGYVVGENGPEWFEPATSGMVVPNHVLGGQTSQTVTVHNSFHLSGPVDRRTQQQVAAASGRAVQIALARNG